MKAERENHNLKVVLTTFILSTVILIALTYLFVTYLMPLYQVDSAKISTVLVRLLPIITGLLLVLIALISAPPVISSHVDGDDELPIEDITAPLYVLPDEEARVDTGPLLDQVGQTPVQKQIVDKNLAPIQRSPVVTRLDPVARPPVILEPGFLGKPPVEEISETSAEETERAPLDRAVRFSSYPFPIEPGTFIEELLGEIEESEAAEVEPDSQLYETVEDAFTPRVEDELKAAVIGAYPVSIGRISVTGDSEALNAAEAALSVIALMYRGENSIDVILPFYSFEQIQMTVADLFTRLKKSFPDGALAFGFATADGEGKGKERLIYEMETALDLALSHGGYSLIGFDPSVEEED